MKNLVEFMNENLKEELNINNVNEENINEAEIKDEKALREYAHAKLKKVHGEEYDEKKAFEAMRDNANMKPSESTKHRLFSKLKHIFE